MSRTSRSLAPYPFRAVLLVLALVLAAVTLLVALPQPAAAIICKLPSVTGQRIEYYSGPGHQQIVGECTCGDCTGIQAAYSTTTLICCPGN